MQYLFLIYGDESKMTPPQNPAEGVKMTAPWVEYTEALKSAGIYQGGAPLQPTATATTVAAVAGKPEPVFTDGPFAETKEQLGGYYLVDCKNLDDALAWAAKCPGVRYGKVEVRPIAVMM